MTKPHGSLATRLTARLGIAFVIAGAVAACVPQDPTPPVPTQVLTPTTIGIVADNVDGPPVRLLGGASFAPAAGSNPQRIWEWSTSQEDNRAGIDAGDLLLGGRRDDGSWWYETVPAPLDEDPSCWVLFGGFFDRHDAVQSSAGLVLPKDAAFAVRDSAATPTSVVANATVGALCVDATGHALYLSIPHGL